MNPYINITQFINLTVAHTKEVTRQPAVLFWGIVFPILLSIGLGFAFTRDAETVHTVGWVSEAKGSPVDVDPGIVHSLLGDAEEASGRNLRFRDDGTFGLTVPDDKLGDTIFIFEPGTWEASVVRLKQGRISLILEAEPDKAGTGGPVFHFDPRNPEARLVWHTLAPLLESSSHAEIRGGEPRTASVSPLELPGTRYIDFLIPGLIAMTVMMSCMWGISYGMIDKRSKKLLRRMVATPMVKSHFLAALMAVRIGINIVESVLLVFFAWLLFGVAIQGSAAALALIFMAGNIAFCGIAVFVSSRTANTEVGNGMINAVVMPMTLLSGVFFSYHNFPEWTIGAIEKLPLALLVDGIRAVFTEGAGIAETAPAAAGLFAIGAVFFGAGLKIFKWH